MRDLLDRIAYSLGYVRINAVTQTEILWDGRVRDMADRLRGKQVEIDDLKDKLERLDAEYGSILRLYSKVKTCTEDYLAKLRQNGIIL